MEPRFDLFDSPTAARIGKRFFVGAADLAGGLEAGGEVPKLAAMDVGDAFRYVFPRLRALRENAASAA